MVTRTATLLLVLSALPASPIGERHASAAGAPNSMCAAARPTRSNTSLPEVKGITTRGTLWALLFYHPPATTRATEKIVLRISGSGPIHVAGIGPSGRRIAPQWGPERHGGSNWNRPGAEWGTGWRFPAPGCWRLHVQRHNASGNIWLQVALP